MSRLNYSPGSGPLKNWLIREEAFDSRYLGKCESIFCLGNGYLNLRSALEEQYVGESRGLFVTGTFNQADQREVTELPNFPDITQIKLTVDGIPFSMSSGVVLNYSRTMNLKTGELTREVLWESPGGKTIRFSFSRFASKAREHVMGLSCTVTPLSGKITLTAETGIDGRMTNSGAQHFYEGTRRIHQGRYLEMISQTTQSHVTAAVYATAGLESPLPVIDRRLLQVQKTISIPQGKPFTLEKLSCVYTSRDLAYRDCAPEEAERRAERDGLQAIREAEALGYEKLLEESKKAWKDYWEKTDIEIESDSGFDQLAVRFALYHLAIMAKTDDSRVGIGAKGMTGQGYKGHSFWDTEIFILPHFLFTQPQAARTLLEYRFHTLPGAYEKARENGYRGAMYPWESAWMDDGEVTPRLGGADIVTGKPIPILTGDLEQHVSADIAYMTWQYFLATGDREFMERCGYEIITQTARFWASRLEWNSRESRYEINDVIGPDEYKEHVNNNAYTNYMAHFNMELALKLLPELERELPALYHRLSLKELGEELGEKLPGLYLPQPDARGLIPQFDGFFQLPQIDLSKYKASKEVGAIYRDYNQEQISGRMVLKQADLLVLFLLRDDLFSREIKEKNYSFYEARTLHDSSLSKSTHSVLACDLDLPREAYEFFRGACETDLGPSPKSSDMGIHSACMGGIWQSAVLGFGGARLVDGKLRISPKLPAAWKRLSYPLVFQGIPLRIVCTPGRVTVENRGTEPVTLELEEKPVTISPM